MIAAESFGSGHINDTYLLQVEQSGESLSYVLQRINQHVFPNPVAVMENIERVTAHIQAVTRKPQNLDRQKELTLVRTVAGDPYLVDADNEYWRLWPYVRSARTVDSVETAQQAHTTAVAFGEFQALIHDLPVPRLHDTIPDFHHTPKRFTQLRVALENDSHARAKDCAHEVDFALNNEDDTSIFVDMQKCGELPERIVHNDAKINNVMLDDTTGKAVCVIDLDTVMPGLALFDFGDLVRTATSESAEDRIDTDNVIVRLDWFMALVEGYLKSTSSFLLPAEIEMLTMAGKIITLETGVRFLTDYLEGDQYFKTDRPKQNLQRCRTQFALVGSINKQYAQMQSIVESINTQVLNDNDGTHQ